MSQKSLSNRLKLIIIGIGLCGAVFYAIILPFLYNGYRGLAPEGTLPLGLIYLWVSGIPCYFALFFAMKIAVNIGKDRSFSEENAVLLKRISTLALIDSAYIFVGCLLSLAFGSGEPMAAVIALVIVFAGIAIAIAAAALSHLVMKAAELQQENDLTI